MVLVTLFIFFPMQGISQNEPTLKGKNVIYVYGGWEGHKPTESVDLMVPKLRAEGANVKVFDTLSVYTNEKLMAQTDLIIQIWTMGKITKKQFEGLEKAIMNGTGFAGWHGGLGDAFRGNLMYQFMVGGQWVAHPDGIIDYEVHVVSDDPIVEGIDAFKMHSEQYYLHVDPGNEVLAATTFRGRESAPWINGTTIPVVWKRMWGEGRVFYSSLGHVASDFDVPEAREIQRRGLIWAAR